jgi:hypothetical protein
MHDLWNRLEIGHEKAGNGNRLQKELLSPAVLVHDIELFR